MVMKSITAMPAVAIVRDKALRTLIGLSCLGFGGPIVTAIGVVVKSVQNVVVS
jgi:hypothetical protein